MTTNPTTVRLNDEAQDQLQALCDWHNLSQSDLFRRLLKREWRVHGKQALAFRATMAALRAAEAPVELRCSVCDGLMGYTPQELQAQVAAKGHDTPTECGFDPANVTWYHGWHKEDIGDPDWDEEEPYWSGSIADLHTAAAAELREEGNDG